MVLNPDQAEGDKKQQRYVIPAHPRTYANQNYIVGQKKVGINLTNQTFLARFLRAKI